MANYTFLDAASSVTTAASSTVGGVQYPIVKISDPVSVVGAVTVSGSVGLTGTVITSVSGTVVVQSIVGTYVDGTARTTAGDPGLYILGYRNDTMASVVSGDKKYTPVGVGQAGEVMTANAPLTAWVQGVASCFTGVAQPVITAQGSSVFTYITSAQATNASANNVYLTITSGANTIAYLTVPANSGALPIMPNAWKGLSNAAISASVSGVSSVFLSFQGFTSKT